MTSNGTGPPDGADGPLEDDDLDDPLDDDEAAAGASAADEAVDESLDERVSAVVEELGGVEARGTDEGIELVVDGRPFALVADDRLEVALDPRVATAAVRTPDTVPSPRGPGWVTFAPATLDRFALDRAESWVRSAHRRASGAR